MNNKLNLKKISLVTTIALVGLFLSLAYISPMQTASVRAQWTYPDGYDPHGVYIDRLTYVVYPAADEQLGLQALQAGLIYAWDERVPADNIAELEATEGVTVETEPAAAYRMFCLNTGRFPTNITAYRRAIAYALDKAAVVQASTGGLAFLQDSALPIALGNWTYEGELTETYYAQNIDMANASLNSAYFYDLDGNGWRDFDANNDSSYNPADGDLLDVDFAVELFHTADHAPSGNAVELAVEGLNLCGIMATVAPQDFTEMLNMIENGQYWLGCFTFSGFSTADVLYDYFHGNAGNAQWYFGGFNESAYNTLAENMMAAATEEEANDWAWACQEYLWYEQPMIVCYNDVYTHAYRTDVWEGYVNAALQNRIGNGYTAVQIRPTEAAGGPWGCVPTEYIQAMNEGMDTSNRIMSTEGYAAMVWQLSYETLSGQSPFDLTYQEGLAYQWETVATVAAGDVQDGEKYTFHIYENATWSDGTDVTTTDVATSIWIAQQDPRRSENYENVYKWEIIDPKTIEIYTNKTGYFEWTRATGFWVFPDAIWNGVNVTAFVPTVEECMASGPFKWTTWVPGQYVQMEPNPYWHFALERPDRTPCPVSGIDPLLLIGIGVVVVVIIIIAGVYFFRIRK
ncbi:MAG: ABC transporter substrate-binding protein [Candidatus Hermodarchaeia archaeon]